MADALHDLGDSLSLGLSWFLDNYSKKPRSKEFSYGYKRFSLLAALINSIILIVGSFFVLREAIPRLLNPQSANATGMLLLAILGIIVNGVAVLRLKKGHSLNECVVSWHLLEDMFGWVAILIIAIINLFTSLPILDPILAIVFSLIILFNIVKSLKQILAIFLQAIPKELNLPEIQNKIKKIKGVKSIHDVHVWTMDGEYHVLTLHVVISKKTTLNATHNIKCNIRKAMQEFNIQHTTIEFETENECCDFENC